MLSLRCIRASASALTTPKRCLASLPTWATVDPASLGTNPKPYAVSNIVNGSWSTSEKNLIIPNPMDKNAPPVCTVPDTQGYELGPFVASLKSVPKSGVHNPMKNVDRYLKFGEISRKVKLMRVCGHNITFHIMPHPSFHALFHGTFRTRLEKHLAIPTRWISLQNPSKEQFQNRMLRPLVK